jgi:hypothetical protein
MSMRGWSFLRELCPFLGCCKTLTTFDTMQIPPLRIIRLLHAVSVSMQQQKGSGTLAAARMDARFYALARYFGSSSLNMSSSLQVGLTEAANGLLLQVVGSSPSRDEKSRRDGAGHSTCCISLTNEFDMSTVCTIPIYSLSLCHIGVCCFTTHHVCRSQRKYPTFALIDTS